jgi:UDP-N-acetylglucosamine--N-acetylmuramyl-(pentapeptide) pyrophosphoryl-undecaprenol N-acetylglucosamine transferase
MPALALGEALAQDGHKSVFLGSQRGLETKLVPEAGFELVALSSGQVMGRGLLGKISGALAILGTVAGARRALKQHRSEIVVSVGGYAAMPATLAAVLMRLPIVLVEPNAVPGRVNRLTARFAKRVFPAFDIAADRLDARARSEVLGVPLRQALVDGFASKDARRSPTAPFRLLVFGGSQGARQINEAMMAAAPRLAALEVEVFHSTGEADQGRVSEAYEKAGLPATVVAFERNLPARYAWADIAICRAGALTIAELALSGLPALLVPYPYAADDHQAANAHELEKLGAARRLRGLEDAEAGGAVIVKTLSELFADSDTLVAMQRASRTMARPNAAREITAACCALLEGKASSIAAGDAS